MCSCASSASEWQSASNSPSTPGTSRLIPKSGGKAGAQTRKREGKQRLKAVSYPSQSPPERPADSPAQTSLALQTVSILN